MKNGKLEQSKNNWLLEAGAIGFLLFLVAVFFYRAIFQGKVVLPMDVLTLLSPWKFYANGVALGNITLSDPIREFYPWKLFVITSLKSGFIPLWNPYILAGTPFISNIQAALFYPFNIIFYLFSPAHGYGYYIILHIFLGGVFMYLYGGSLSLSRAAKIAAATVFMFNMFVISWAQQIPLLSVVIWLPLIFLLLEKMMATRSIAYAFWVAIVLALQVFGGNIQFSFYIFVVTGLYFIFRLFTVWYEERDLRIVSRLLALVTAVLVSTLALVAIQLLPTFEMLDSIVRQGDSYKVVMTGAFKIEHLRTFLLPHYFNDPGKNFTWSSFPLYSGYVGIFPLLLALFALFFKRDKYTFFFGGLAILSLLLAFGTPVYKVLYYLPLGSTLRNPARLIFLYVFSLSVLCGLGMNYLTDFFKRGTGGFHLSERTSLEINTKIFLYFSTAVMGLAILFLPEALYQLVAKNAPITYLTREISLFIFLLSASSLSVALLLRRKINVLTFKILAVGLIVFDLFFYSINFLSYVEPKIVYFKTPSINFLLKDKDFFRVARFGKEPLYSPLTPDTGMVYGLSDIQGSDVFILKRYADFLNLIEDRKKETVFNEISNLTKLKSLNSHLLDLLNVKYILSTGEIPGWSKHKVYDRKNKDMRIYKNPSSLPRGFLVSDFEVIKTKKKILNRIKRKDFDPSRVVIFEKEPRFVTSPKNSHNRVDQQSTFRSSRVKITNYEPNRINFSVRSDKNNFLVLSEVYYPGWRSYVNGKKAEILRANYILRAIYLPAGNHKVEFVFEPKSYKLGQVITGLSGLFIIIYLAISNLIFKSARRRSKNSPEETGNQVSKLS